MSEKNFTTIGRNVHIDLIGHVSNVPAKVDTGADSSSISVSDLTMLSDGTLQYTLFDINSPFYTGTPIQTQDYVVTKVRSSTGHEEVRYQVSLSVRIKGRRINATFNLSRRAKNLFPILIGRKTLSGKFIVDVSLSDEVVKPAFEKQTKELNEELQKDPKAFYEKYHG
jgi:hypothetical protein